MTNITIRLLKPAKDTVITYAGTIIERDERHLRLVAIWTWAANDLGYIVFETGDRFYEYFYTDRWYNIFEIHRADGTLKGWYCNITRPAIFHADVVESEDLELDLFVAPDRQTLLVLDKDEFAARALDATDPEAYTAALTALETLQTMARQGAPPFDEGGNQWIP